MEIERIRGMSLLDDESSGDCEDEDYIDIDHDDVYEEITDDTNNPSVRVSALSGYASIYSSDTPEKENTTSESEFCFNPLYWKFSKYVVSYELQELKYLSKPVTKNVIKTSCIVSFSMKRSYLFIG